MSIHWRFIFCAVSFALAGSFFAGCASNEASRGGPRDDLADFRQAAIQAQRAFDHASAALDQVAASETTCPPSVVASYQKAVQDLEVVSVQARAKAQAILARGDAYFADWEEHVEQMQGMGARALMEERRPELEDTFNRLKAGCAQTHDAFQPFLSGLRQLRTVLENNPDTLSNEATRNLISNTQLHAQQVRLCIDAVRKSLDDFAAQVREIKVAAQH